MAVALSDGRFRELDAKKNDELIERGFGIADGEGVVLSASEALYLISKGRLIAESEKNEKMDFEKVMKMESSLDSLMEQKYVVYRHLRENGHVARISKKGDDGYYRVYRKGKRIGDEPAKYLVKVIGAEWKGGIEEIEAEVRKASALRKELVLARAQTDGTIEFVKIGRASFD